MLVRHSSSLSTLDHVLVRAVARGAYEPQTPKTPYDFAARQGSHFVSLLLVCAGPGKGDPRLVAPCRSARDQERAILRGRLSGLLYTPQGLERSPKVPESQGCCPRRSRPRLARNGPSSSLLRCISSASHHLLCDSIEPPA